MHFLIQFLFLKGYLSLCRLETMATRGKQRKLSQETHQKIKVEADERPKYGENGIWFLPAEGLQGSSSIS